MIEHALTTTAFTLDGYRIVKTLGVVRGVKVEELYREVRALRIYEGTSEIQKLIIARELLRGGGGEKTE